MTCCISQMQVRALACKVDMRSVEQVERCVADTMAAFGRIDILINNASALWWQVRRSGC
jgi:citronellol/citronellal dehydrogenase